MTLASEMEPPRTPRWQAALLWAVMCVLGGACAPSEAHETSVNDVSDGLHTESVDSRPLDSVDAASTDIDGADVVGLDTSQPHGHVFRIELDYSFDEPGFFSDPKRRKTLEAAAATWSAIIKDDFETVPAGTTIKVRNPSKPLEPSVKITTTTPIDDLRIYVSCSTDNVSLGKAFITSVWSTTTELGAKLKERFKGDDYEPWAMAIAFNCDKPWYFDQTPETVDDLPSDKNDFLSTARHEIGHCLGLINAAVAKSKIQTIDDAPYFVGTYAVQEFGGPVPLEPDGRHLKNGLLSGGTEARMDPSTKKGTRKWPTPVDIALLRDIGYDVAQ